MGACNGKARVCRRARRALAREKGGDRPGGARGEPRGGELLPRKPRGSGDRGRLGAVRFDHSAVPTWAAGFASEILRGQRRQHRFEIGREAFVFIGHSRAKPFGLSPPDRKSVVEGKSVYVSVALVARRILKKKTN